jgi:hypothetical protein
MEHDSWVLTRMAELNAEWYSSSSEGRVQFAPADLEQSDEWVEYPASWFFVMFCGPSF